MKILIVVNPNSGMKGSKSQFIKVLSVFSKYKNTVEVYATQSVGDGFRVVRSLKKKYDAICVFGGDGTLNEVINGMMELKEKPMLGYFPSGTMNDFANNFDLTSDWERIAERICTGNYQEFDVGLCNDKYFDYVAAFGAMCDVPYSTRRSAKEAIGNLAYLIEGMSKIPEVKPVKLELKVNGKVKKHKALFGLVFSGCHVAGIELVDKNKSSVSDGEFNILIVDFVDAVPGIEIPDLIRTAANQNKHIHWYKASEVEFKMPSDTKWTLDGEKAEPGEVIHITNIKRALRMLS